MNSEASPVKPMKIIIYIKAEETHRVRNASYQSLASALAVLNCGILLLSTQWIPWDVDKSTDG